MTLSEEKAATLPRKSGGMYVKAHQNGMRKLKSGSSSGQIRETFVDDGAGSNDEQQKTQTLPRSYKSGIVTKNRIVPAPPDHAVPMISRAQSTNSVMDHGINLIVSSNSFVSRTKPKIIRPVLTVQEKLAQDIPSLPPQVRNCLLFRTLILIV